MRPWLLHLLLCASLSAPALANAEAFGPYRWKRSMGPAEWRAETSITVEADAVTTKTCQGMAFPGSEPPLSCSEAVATATREGDALRWTDEKQAYALDLSSGRLVYRDGDAPELTVAPGAPAWPQAPVAP